MSCNILVDSAVPFLAITKLVSDSLLSAAELDRLLGATRSEPYLHAIAALNAGRHSERGSAFDSLLQIILDEFPNVLSQYPLLGIMARCSRGLPGEVYLLDLCGKMVLRYETAQAFIGRLECARLLALHDEYRCIEVYFDRMVAICPDGTTSLFVS